MQILVIPLTVDSTISYRCIYFCNFALWECGPRALNHFTEDSKYILNMDNRNHLHHNTWYVVEDNRNLWQKMGFTFICCTQELPQSPNTSLMVVTGLTGPDCYTVARTREIQKSWVLVISHKYNKCKWPVAKQFPSDKRHKYLFNEQNVVNPNPWMNQRVILTVWLRDKQNHLHYSI